MAGHFGGLDDAFDEPEMIKPKQERNLGGMK